MQTYFLFLDDSVSPIVRDDGAKIVSLTGLLVEISIFNSLRESFYNILKPFFFKKMEDGTNFYDKVPEIHGSNMLRDNATDEEKIRVYSEIASLVESKSVPIYRIGYYMAKDKSKQPNNERDGKSLCFSSFLHVLQPIYESAYLIPIMDAFNQDVVNSLSGSVQWVHGYRSIGGKGLSLSNSENIIGDVFFTDSKFSSLTQVVDVIAYLRCINDQFQEGVPLTNFKLKVHDTNNLLRFCLKYDQVVEMNVKVVDRISRKSNPV
jgi:Protein of unknown function (DUF3800)